MDSPSETDNSKVAEVFKALGHPTRVFIVKELSAGELPAGYFAEKLDADFSTISQHLNVLKRAGVIESQKRGLNVFYRLVYPCIPWLISRMEYRDRISESEAKKLMKQLNEQKRKFESLKC